MDTVFFLSFRVQRAKFKGFKHRLLSLGITGPNLPLRCFKDPMGQSIPFLLLEKHTNIIWFIIYWVWRQEAFEVLCFFAKNKKYPVYNTIFPSPIFKYEKYFAQKFIFVYSNYFDNLSESAHAVDEASNGKPPSHLSRTWRHINDQISCWYVIMGEGIL